MIRFKLVIAALSVVTTIAAPCAASDKVGLIKRMLGEIKFSSSSSVPDELDAALKPYIACNFALSGTLAATPNGVTRPSPPASGNCDAARENARQAADTKLVAMGITDAADRNAIVENSLLVSELNAAGNAEYMRRYVR